MLEILEQRSDSGVAETDIDVYDGDTDLPVSSAGKRKASAGSSEIFLRFIFTICSLLFFLEVH